MPEGPIVNKVKKSDKLVTVNLEKFWDDTPIAELDLKDFLIQELMLKEDDFRSKLDEHNWSQYDGQYLCVYCSTDAIVAPWAYMLIAAKASEHAKDVFKGTPEEARHELFRRTLDEHDWSQYENKFAILKGCSDKPVPASVYMLATQKLTPYVKKLMYGEACSNVPIYRKRR